VSPRAVLNVVMKRKFPAPAGNRTLKTVIITVSEYNNGNNTLKTSVNNTMKGFNRFSTRNGCTIDIACNKESSTVWNLKPEWWDAPLVQGEKYQGRGNL